MAQAQINAKKQIVGNTPNPPDETFKFNLITNGQIVASTQSDSQGNVAFPPVTINQAGEADYIIVEVPDDPPKSGWTYDRHQCVAHVSTKEDPQTHELVSTVTYPDTSPVFTNTYAGSAPASTGDYDAPKAAKTVVGGQMTSGQFAFGLFDENGKQIASSSNDAAGEIKFPAMTFDKTGEYLYTIRETTPDGEGWTTDKRSSPYKVVVDDNGSGQLVATVTYPEGKPSFVNYYSPAPASTGNDSPKAHKTCTGGSSLEAGQFNFGVYDSNGNLIESAANDADGNVTFPPLTFPHSGEYNYTIRESTPDGGGWQTDKSSYPYKVVVTDNGSGQLVASVTAPNPPAEFENKYTVQGSESILAYKKLQGWNSQQSPPAFSFTLRDSSGQLVKTATDENGAIDFGALSFTEQGDYDYVISEDTPLPPGWSSSGASYRVRVHMADDGKGGLVASVSYPDGQTSPTFVNTYSARPANVGSVIQNNPSGKNPLKLAEGAALPNSRFSFGMFDESGSLVAVGFNNADGSIRFPLFYKSKLGTEKYTLKELTTSGKGWTTDRTEFPVNVTISDDGQGSLSASVDYPGETPVFRNIYSAAPASTGEDGAPKARKMTVGGQLKPGQFSFALLDQNGNTVAVASNDAAGEINFPAMTFDKTGEYDYTIRETTPDGGGWHTDKSSYPYKVVVTDNGQGQLIANATEPSPPAVFVNTFDDFKPTQTTVCARKKVCGARLCAEAFDFALLDENGVQIDLTSNDAKGNICFTMTFNAPGVYRRAVKELTVSCGGWHSDERIFGFSVTVTANSEGVLESEVVFDSGDPPVFINRYCDCTS